MCIQSNSIKVCIKQRFAVVEPQAKSYVTLMQSVITYATCKSAML